MYYLRLSKELRFLLLAIVVFTSVSYSTIFHLAFGQVKTIEPTTYLEKEFLANLDTSLKLKTEMLIRLENIPRWQWTSASGDARQYVNNAEELSTAIPPFQYRVFVPGLVYILRTFLPFDTHRTFALLNFAFLLATATLYTMFLRYALKLEQPLSLIGGILSLTILSHTRTGAYPLVDPATNFFALLVFMAAYSGAAVPFLIASVLGVATKEILLFATPLWLATQIHFATLTWRRAVFHTSVAAVPLMVFIVLRLSQGGPALDVNYGFDLLNGELPSYAHKRLTQWSAFFFFVKGITLYAFGPLWLGVLNVRRNPFLFRATVTVPVVWTATFFFSGRVERVQGVLFPIVITLFLFFFTLRPKPQESKKLS